MGMLLRRHYVTVGAAEDAVPAKENKEVEKAPALTKADINKMNKETLIATSKENGIADAEKIAYADLKKALVQKLGL